MTPQELKNSILQLAIQGKLVEQRTEEGTAEELYQQIQAEKQRLIKEGKIKKEKPLPAITEAEKPFDIPESWKWVQLRSLVYSRGQMVPQSTFSYIDIGSIDNKNQTLNFEENIICADKAPSRARKIIEIGDILYSTVRPYLHNMCIIDKNFSCTPIASTGFAAMTCYTGVFNQFLFRYLMSPAFDSYANDTENAKGVAYPAINDDRLYRAIVPLPPLAEQKRIVAKIEELLPYIDRYEQAWSKLENFNKRFPTDMQKSILQMAIQGKLVEQRPEESTGEELYQQIQAEKQRLIKAGKIKKEKPLQEITEEEKPFDIPESWKWARWGSLSESIQYGYNAPAQAAGRIKMVRISDIQEGKVLWDSVPYCEISEDEIATYLLKENDILFARTGGTVGKSYIVKEVPDESIYAGYLIRTRYSSLLCPDYLKHFMDSQLYWIQLRNGTIATAQPNCNGQTLAKMIVPLPPLSEQKRIVAKLEEILPLCEKLK